jgi:hypothetical protein
VKSKTAFVFKCALTIHLFFLLYSTNVFSAQKASGNNLDIAANAGWSAFARGGFVHQMDADIDGGGSFSVNRFFVQTGPSYTFVEGSSLSLALGYGFDDYDFSGKTAFGSRQPWDDIHSFRVSIPWRWKVNEKWMGFISPTLRYAGAQGVVLNDALTFGGFAAFSYRYNKRLSIGPGFGILTQLEDNIQIIPILVIQWKITDALSLQTGRGIGATLGPGLTLAWQPNKVWSFSLGGRYEKLRFRLDDNATVPNGIGEDRSFPIFTGIEYRFNPKTRISLIGGIEVGGELRLQDSDGGTLTEENHDSAGFLGITFSARF